MVPLLLPLAHVHPQDQVAHKVPLTKAALLAAIDNIRGAVSLQLGPAAVARMGPSFRGCARTVQLRDPIPVR